MDILLISPEAWDAHEVSKHHYARTLESQGHRVFFLDPPVHGRPLTLEPIPGHQRLIRVRGPRVAPGLQRMPSSLCRWLEHRWLRRLESLAGCRIEVIWLFENSRFFNLNFAGSRLKIYHQVDLNQNFHPAIAAQTADICFCTSKLIQQRLLPHNARCYCLQHGVATLAKPTDLSQAELDLFSREQVQAMYIGNLEITCLDCELIASVVRANRQISFHLIGAYNRDGKLYLLLEGCHNVTWWGKVNSSLIPSLLAQADVLMVCYQSSYHRDASNPHKLMEYLASGSMVIATYTEEYKQHSELLAMSQPESNAGYPKLFSSVVKRLSNYTTPDRMEARRAFAAENTYSKQIERVETHLSRHGFSLSVTSTLGNLS
jgi:hypothetical protein